MIINTVLPNVLVDFLIKKAILTNYWTNTISAHTNTSKVVSQKEVTPSKVKLNVTWLILLPVQNEWLNNISTNHNFPQYKNKKTKQMPYMIPETGQRASISWHQHTLVVSYLLEAWLITYSCKLQCLQDPGILLSIF